MDLAIVGDLVGQFEAGASDRLAARRTGAARRTVRRYRRLWRAGLAIAAVATSAGFVAALRPSQAAAAAIVAEASARGTTAADLAGRLLERVAELGLAGTLLD